MKAEKLSPEAWFKQANDYAIALNYSTTGNFEEYEDYYNDGYTPEEAIREDISNSN